MLALTIREKNGEERQLIFEKEEVTIGRATGSDIVLPRNNISKRHARLVDKHDKVVIVDLRSTNGTYVNGRRITAPELLTYDDKVYIGDFVIRLSRPAEQHPSQKMTAPYSASPTPAEARSARAATAAVDPMLPPPLEEPDFPIEEEPIAPPRPVAMPPMPPDDDESTRAIIAMPEDEELPPPPPRVKPEMPKPPAPPRPRVPSAPQPPVAPPTPMLQVPKAPRPPRAVEELPETFGGAELSQEQGAGFADVTIAASIPVAPVVDTHAELDAEDGGTSEFDSAQRWSEGDYDPWAEWNAAVETVVARIEAEHPDGFEDAAALAAAGVDEAISSGAIAAETDRAALIEDVVVELTQGGPLAELCADPGVRLVAMNGPKSIHVARSTAPSVLEANGRVFATIRSYRRALAALSGRDEEVIADLVGLDEHRLADGAVLRFIGSGTSIPHAVWQRAAAEVPLLPDLVADGLLDAAQAQLISQTTLARGHIAVVGAASAGRATLASAIAAEYGLDRRVVVVGDGTRLALAQSNVARVASSAVLSGAHLAALEPELIVFERLEVGTGSDWTEAGLLGGAPILTVLDGAVADKALKRLGLAVELATGLEGRGAAIVGECIDLVVTLGATAEGSAKVEKIHEVESHHEGFSLKAPVRR